MKKYGLLLATIFMLNTIMIGQETEKKRSIAVVSVDTKGLELDNLSMGNLVRIELEKLGKYEVLDKYDATIVMQRNSINPEECFGKTQLVQVGSILQADLMMTGSAEKFGDKIIMILRLVDVKDQSISKTSVMEYVYQEEYIQVMVRLSLNKLFDIENDKETEDMLVNLDMPITSEKTTLRLNGPRFGMQFFTGEYQRRLAAPATQGGYHSVAYGSVFGYQHEIQYVSKGDFQALFEFIGTVNGIETNHASFSLTVLNGLRYRGWEVGFGPVFRGLKMAEGYYDSNGNWNLASESNPGVGYEVFKNIDSRGTAELNTALIVAVGKSFSIGYLNLPVNFYWSPRSQISGHVFGMMLGFNVAKKPKQRATTRATNRY